MTPRECLLLIPGCSLDDFPKSLPSKDADNFLSGWLALWHPVLLAGCRCAPRWHRADQPPHDLSGLLIVLPSISQNKISSDFGATVALAGGYLANAKVGWKGLQGELLAAIRELPQPASKTGTSDVPMGSGGGVDMEQAAHPDRQAGAAHPDRQAGCTDSEREAGCASLLDDFAALGFAYLQIQLMTRQLRYTSNLDQLQFDDQLTQAAVAAIENDQAKADQMLQSCFDSLGQERDHYYSSEVQLLDVTLLAQSTLGPALSRQLARNLPTTLVASANLFDKMLRDFPDNLARVQQLVTDNQISIAGGLETERPHALMALESTLRDLHRGRTAYQRLGVAPPTVFARFSFGILPDMPLHLRRAGFSSALLIPWDTGTYPHGSQAKLSWEAAEGTFVSALTPNVIDVADPASFLSLGWRVGEALDHQNVPTVVLAHWPDRYASYFDLLARISRRTPALGRLTHAQVYFDKTDQPYHQERLPAKEFRHDWLGNVEPPSSAADLLSAVVEYHRCAAKCRSLLNLANLSYQIDSLMKSARSNTESRANQQPPALAPLGSEPPALAAGGGTDSDGGGREGVDLDLDPSLAPSARERSAHENTAHEGSAPLMGQSFPLAAWNPELAKVLESVDAMLDQPELVKLNVEGIHRQLDAVAHSLTCKIAKSIGYSVEEEHESKGQSPVDAVKLVLNPQSNPLRIPLRSDKHLRPRGEARWCYASGRVGEYRVSMVDIPAYGLLAAQLEAGTEIASHKERPLAEAEGLMFNDFLEIQIDPRAGHLRSLHVPARRGNRLSMQVARREVLSSKEVQYSEVRAGSIRLLGSSNVFGLLRASGELWFQSKKTGTFEIDYELLRGSRIVEVTIRLDALADLRSDPWQSAYIVRIAWPNESAILTHYTSGVKYTWSRGEAVSPLLIEIDETDYHTHLLTGGLAFHRRVADRFLETLLAVQGTTRIDQKIGIGVDLPYPRQSAEQFVDRQYLVDVVPPSKSMPESQWFMHVDSKNVWMQLDSPLVDSEGRDCGIRVHLIETAGKSSTTRVRCLREIRDAHRVDYLGQELGRVTADRDSLSIVLRPHEMVFVDVYWKTTN